MMTMVQFLRETGLMHYSDEFSEYGVTSPSLFFDKTAVKDSDLRFIIGLSKAELRRLRVFTAKKQAEADEINSGKAEVFGFDHWDKALPGGLNLDAPENGDEENPWSDL